MELKHFWFAYAVAWIAVSAAVIVGLYFTKDARCLWAFVIPGFISFSSRSESDDEDEDEAKK